MKIIFRSWFFVVAGFVLGVLVFTACYNLSGKSSSHRNVAFLYNPLKNNLKVEYRAFHSTDTTTMIYFSVPVDQLLYMKTPEDEGAVAIVRLAYRLYIYNENNNMVDSASFEYDLVKNDVEASFINSVNIPTRKLQKYILELSTTDMIRKRKHLSFMVLDRYSKLNRQHYLVTNKQGVPYFGDHFGRREKLFIHHSSGQNAFQILYFKDEFGLPVPPFSIKNNHLSGLEPDSSWTVHGDDESYIVLEHPGMYHVQMDTASNKGLTLFNFSNVFPNANTPAGMLEPIRYLSSKKEYDEFEMFEKKKIAIDDFWMKAGGNANRAKELIRIYYNRVMLANTYFTSHTEGWKTDRGMIYIIFGAPNSVYKSTDSETWIYGDDANNPALNFAFSLMTNPFSNNNYSLRRNEIYSTSWYQAVDTWRNGRVYSVSN